MVPRRGITIIVVILANTHLVNAQSLSEHEAKKLVDARMAKTYPLCGKYLPLGEHKFTVPEGTTGMPKHDLVKTVNALETAQVIKVIGLPAMLGQIRFRVELDPKSESYIIRNYLGSSKTCLVHLLEAPNTEVVATNTVKGGTTGWIGAVIYTKITNRVLSPPYIAYLRARGEPWRLGDLRVRSLWKYDVFKKQWLPTRYRDSGPLNGEFFTNNIARGLRSE